MAVLRETEYAGVTAHQYDILNQRVGTHAGRTIPGLISHFALITDDGLRVLDLWESEQAMEAFLPTLRPAFESAGFPAPASPPRLTPVHNVFLRP